MREVGRSASIWVEYQFMASHYWPEPTPHRAYLGSEHVHNFHFTAFAHVEHSERQIEFHDLRGMLESAVKTLVDKQPNGPYTFGSKSCETIANDLLDLLPKAVYQVQVDEDEVCGAIVTKIEVND